MKVDDGLSADLIKIISTVNKSEMSTFMKFCLGKTFICYHPIIIPYCLAFKQNLLLHTIKSVIIKASKKASRLEKLYISKATF